MKRFTIIIADSVKLALFAVMFSSLASVLGASVISTTTTSCVDETTGLSIAINGNCFDGAVADSTVSGFGGGNLVVDLSTGAGGGPIFGDQLLFTAEADATVVAYTPGPLRAGFLSIDYHWEFENNSAGTFGGDVSVDGLLPRGRSGELNIPYEIGTPFTLRSTANSQAFCIPTGFCGVGAFASTATVFAHYLVPDGANQLWVGVPILDYSPTATPEPRSSAIIVLSVVILLGLKRGRVGAVRRQ